MIASSRRVTLAILPHMKKTASEPSRGGDQYFNKCDAAALDVLAKSLLNTRTLQQAVSASAVSFAKPRSDHDAESFPFRQLLLPQVKLRAFIIRHAACQGIEASWY
jgi:hypothetical protein